VDAAAIPQHPRGIAGRQIPMVGRHLELTLLHASYARVQAERRPHLITILGTPGVGKSRLVREFINREQELAKSASSSGRVAAPLVLTGRCLSYGEGITYWPLIEILRTLLHSQESDTTEMFQQRFVDFLHDTFARAKNNESAEQIAETLLRQIGRNVAIHQNQSSNEPGYVERSRPGPQPAIRAGNLKQNRTQGTLLRAWRVLFETLAELQPLIIVVDDLQWADEALLELLEYLTDRITTVPILFLCPARPDFLEQHREWGGGHRNFTAIELDALTREESSELVDTLLNTSDLPEALRNTILSRAEGNPFFVEEIVRMFVDQGVLVLKKEQTPGSTSWNIAYTGHTVLEEPGQQSTIEHLDENALNNHMLVPLPHVPDTIQGVLAARIDLLAPTEKVILQHGSVIGRTFWLSTLLEMVEHLPQSTVLEALASLIRRDFITETRTQNTSPLKGDRVFAFKHILIRDVVYNNIPRQRRSYEHAHIAHWFEEQTESQQTDFIELIAYHYQRALATWSSRSTVSMIKIEPVKHTDKPPVYLSRADLRKRAITYLTRTGDQALHRYAGLHALQAYDDAFDLLAEGHAEPLIKSQMLTRIAEAQTQQGNLDEALRQSRNALKLATTEGVTADNAHLLKLYEHLSLLATRWYGRLDTPPNMQEIREYINAGLHILAGTPTSRQYIAFLTYEAFWYIRQMDEAPQEKKNELIEQALQSGHCALRMAEELNNPRTLSLTLDAMGLIYLANHSYAKAREMQEKRLQLVALISDKEELYDLYASLGAAYEQVDEYASALTCYGQAWSNARAMESAPMVLNSMVKRMRAWRRWNRWDNARQVAEEIRQFIERYRQDEKRQLWALETLATIAYHRGDQEEGDMYTRQYKRLTESKDAHPSVATFHAIHLAQTDWKLATADYLEKIRKSEPFPRPDDLSILAELAITTTMVDHPDVLCNRAIALCETSGAPKSLAVSLRARGRLHIQQQNWQQAEEDLRKSLRICEKLDLPWECAHTLYYLGLLYQHRSLTVTGTDIQTSNQQLAQNYLEQALGFYQSLGAQPSVEMVRAALDAIQ
jgi:predicted ATPase